MSRKRPKHSEWHLAAAATDPSVDLTKLAILEASSAVSRARLRHPDACDDPSDVLEKEFVQEASPSLGAPGTGHVSGGHFLSG